MDEMTPPDWLHLKPYGYAPGGYMSRCRKCDDTPVMDKRATACRPCAEKMHAAALAARPAGGPILSHYFKFERGERLQKPGELATFYPASGLAYYDGLTLDQRMALDELIRAFLDEATKLREEGPAAAAVAPTVAA